MTINWAVLGATLAALVMLLLALKWKLPMRQAVIGLLSAAIVSALAFVWIYPLVGQSRTPVAVIGLQILAALLVGGVALMLRFWRDPERAPPDVVGAILSAADGTIEYVWTIEANDVPIVRKRGRDYRLEELTGARPAEGGVYVVGVGMTYLDVHVNRCPIHGEVTLTTHTAGRFMSLRKPEAPFVNERLTTVIRNEAIHVAVVQIASRLVRRVRTYLSEGSSVAAGERLGIIRFGSLVAIIIPARQDVSIDVVPGDYVRAGVSIIAHYRPSCLAPN